MKANVVLGLSAVILLSSCAGTIKGRALAEPKVVEFHDKLAEGKWSEIYEGAHPEFKNATDEQEFSELLAEVGKRYGERTSHKIVSSKSSTLNMDTTVVLVSRTTFEKGTALETFTYKLKNGEAALYGYEINPVSLGLK
ncbi:MAG: hypothetical protein R3242_03875 [Akkermansiaceae bacterium]|nr:hypothetical protein [Akkermansiaceae bacterium]